MKILPVGAQFFHAGGQTDGQTDRTKLIVAFRNFPNAPKNELIVHYTKSSVYIDQWRTEGGVGG
jgi:hypothetical protein